MPKADYHLKLFGDSTLKIMSTRCQIGFYEKESKDLNKFEALIYRHSDGYPESEHGVIKAIKPFLKWFKKERGIDDIEYVSARLLQWLCNKYDERDSRPDKKGNFTGILGHGICKYIHNDIVYLYAIYPNAIKVYEIGKKCFDKNYNLKDINKAKLLETITI